MAHIPDGVVSNPVLVVGAVVAAGALAVALKRLDPERIPATALLSATFFIVSMVPVPLGVTTIHLLLTGLMGIMLGWTAVPAILIALMLQALRRALERRTVFLLGSLAGLLGVVLTATMVAFSLALSGSEFVTVAKAVVPMYLPVALLEGVVTGSIVVFLFRVRPELLKAPATANG